jgi:hypothetical protein
MSVVGIGCETFRASEARGLAWIRRSANQCQQDAIRFLTSDGYPAGPGCRPQSGRPGELVARYFSGLPPWIWGGGPAINTLP